MAVDWGRVGEALFIKRERSNLAYLKALNDAEDMKDSAQLRDFQAVLQAKKAEYETDVRTFQSLRQFMLDKNNIDLAERQAKIQENADRRAEAQSKRDAETHQRTMDERKQKAEENKFAFEQQQAREAEIQKKVDSRSGYERAIEADRALMESEMGKEAPDAAKIENWKANIAKNQAEVDRLGAEIEAAREIAQPKADTKTLTEKIAEYEEILGKSLTEEQKQRALGIEESAAQVGKAPVDKISEAEKALGRELTEDEKLIALGLKSRQSDPATGDWWQTDLQLALEGSTLNAKEQVMVADFLKPKLGSFSKRSVFAQKIISDTINAISKMEGPTRVTDYIDAYNKLGEDPDLEPVRGIARKIGTTKLGASNPELKNAVEFDLEQRLAAGKASGDYTLLAEGILTHTRTFAEKATQRIVDQRKVLTQAGYRLNKMLDELEAGGVDVGLWDGTKEGLAQIVGGTSDPRYARFQNTAQLFSDLYVTTKSGASFTDSEVNRALRLFPAIRKGVPLNRAAINTLVENGVNMTLSALAQEYGSYLNEAPITAEQWVGAIENTTIHSLDVPADVITAPDGVDASTEGTAVDSTFYEDAAKGNTSPEDLKRMLLNNSKFKVTPEEADEMVADYKKHLESRKQ